MENFKLDRTAFKAHSHKDAARHAAFYRKMSWQERLKVAAYLNSVAFNFDINNPPPMDRTRHSVKSLQAANG